MKKNASRLLALLMVLVLSVSLVACSGGNNNEEPAPNQDISQSTSDVIDGETTEPVVEDPTDPAETDPAETEPGETEPGEPTVPVVDVPLEPEITDPSKPAVSDPTAPVVTDPTRTEADSTTTGVANDPTKPADTTNKPAGTTQGTQATQGTTNKPANTTNKPAGTTQGTQATQGTAKPTNKPANTTVANKPTNKPTNKPASTTVANKPTNKPVSTTVKPNNPEVTQTTGTTGTTKRTKPIITVTGPTTTTTTEAATTTKFVPKNPLRVLSIGHSFSKDAMETYLWDLLNESGEYDYIVIAYLFYPGCSLDRQWYNINGMDENGKVTDKDGNRYEYQQYRKTDPETGAWTNVYQGEFKNLAHKAIQDEQWDIITLQPSPDYGAGPDKCQGVNDYDHVLDLVNWINSKKTNPNAKIYYHMTWSFAEDCRLWSFMYSNYDQVQMFKDFVAATRAYVISTGKFSGLIPAGTSIQNARSSRLGDVFNMPGEYDPKKDGYHLNDRGDYVAALTWYSVLTGKSATTAWCPDKYKDDFNIFAEAVDAGIKNPYNITQSSYQ